MRIVWTDTQLARLKELEAGAEDLDRGFETDTDRDKTFQVLEKKNT